MALDTSNCEGMSDRLIENAEKAHEWARTITPRLDPKKLAQAMWVIGMSEEAMSDIEVQMQESVDLYLSGSLPPRMAALLYCDELPQSIWMIKLALIFNAHTFNEEEEKVIARKIAEFEKVRDEENEEIH